jgi:NADP-dependent 3-hydroxy acid dehydrogenase YdfG
MSNDAAPAMTPPRPLEGKVAWLTGAGSGIGRAGAIELAKAGAIVVVSGRRAPQLEETLALVRAAGGAGHAAPLDVSDKAQVEQAGQAILARLGAIDILVNSAGTNVPKRYLADLTATDWDYVTGINLNGSVYTTLASLPSMRRRGGGLVINVSSWLGRYGGYLGGIAYNATKHGMAAMTQQLNHEEGIHGIRACVIYPGEVATPILKTRPVPPSDEEMARMLQAEDLGRTIRFVAEAPAHVCFNEIVIAPTWNRLQVGAPEIKRGPLG